eukprot:1809459-Pleurochrysis_carterae.AAC.1
MALEHQRLLDVADAAAAGRARPPDHPPFARPIQPPLTPISPRPGRPESRPPDRRANLCGGRRPRRRGAKGRVRRLRP